MLELRDVQMRFAGLQALAGVSLTLPAGQIVGLIGPNGAGKTTLFNVISGLLRPSAGQVLFEGHDISRYDPALRNRMGIARTFQVVKPFAGLSVLDNVIVGALTRGQSLALARDTARQTLLRLDLERFSQQPARSLPLALRKRLELARALATAPRLLLLDEMMGGLNPSEVQHTLELLLSLHAEGLSFLVIEHNMQAIMRLAQTVIVLHQGALLCQGTPAQVSQDPRVVSVYLGEPHGAA